MQGQIRGYSDMKMENWTWLSCQSIVKNILLPLSERQKPVALEHSRIFPAPSERNLYGKKEEWAGYRRSYFLCSSILQVYQGASRKQGCTPKCEENKNISIHQLTIEIYLNFPNDHNCLNLYTPFKIVNINLDACGKFVTHCACN